MWVSIDSTLKIAIAPIKRVGCVIELPPSGDSRIVPKWEAMQWLRLLQNSAWRIEEPMSATNLNIGELEAKYPLYCKALKILIKQGKTSAQLQRTLCWDRLRLLHRSLPRQYKSPERLMLMIQAEFSSVTDA